MAVRMAHIQLPEDLGIEDAILPGDPARVDRVAALLEQPEELMFNREYKSVRGLWKGRPVLIISTGMGGPSTAIAVEELARTGVRQMIRIGSCGALTPTLDLGDLVLVGGVSARRIPRRARPGPAQRLPHGGPAAAGTLSDRHCAQP